jgi:hypothetical protein
MRLCPPATAKPGITTGDWEEKCERSSAVPNLALGRTGGDGWWLASASLSLLRLWIDRGTFERFCSCFDTFSGGE